MKKDIHPKYYHKAQVECACGNKFSVGDTVEELKVDICYKCHPFYTGEEKLIDVARRAEKFKARQSAKKTNSTTKKTPGKKVRK
jgi:large subunit ribosomal protein L31